MPDRLHAFAGHPPIEAICRYIEVHAGKQTHGWKQTYNHTAAAWNTKNDRLARCRAELGDESQEAAQGFLRATDAAHGHQPFSTSHIFALLLVSLQRGPHVALRKLS